jgi:hypothetical protein
VVVVDSTAADNADGLKTGYKGPVMRNNALLTPLDDLPSTCDTPYFGGMALIMGT